MFAQVGNRRTGLLLLAVILLALPAAAQQQSAPPPAASAVDQVIDRTVARSAATMRSMT